MLDNRGGSRYDVDTIDIFLRGCQDQAFHCCLGAYSLIFFFNGLMHGPFFRYTVARALAGFAQGGFAPLVNTIIGENFESEARGGIIAIVSLAWFKPLDNEEELLEFIRLAY